MCSLYLYLYEFWCIIFHVAYYVVHAPFKGIKYCLYVTVSEMYLNILNNEAYSAVVSA